MPRNFDRTRIQNCASLYGFNHDALEVNRTHHSRIVDVGIHQDDAYDGVGLRESCDFVLDPRFSRFEDY